MVFGLDALAPWLVAALIAVLFVAFAREWRPPEVTAGLAVSALLILGILSVDDVLAHMSEQLAHLAEALRGEQRREAARRP